MSNVSPVGQPVGKRFWENIYPLTQVSRYDRWHVLTELMPVQVQQVFPILLVFSPILFV